MTDAHTVKKSATKKDWIWKLLLSGTCLAPLSLSAAQVEGIITDADAEWPLAHTNVAVSTGKAGTVTDSLGRYELELPPGRYRVEVSIIGYGIQSQQIDLLAGPKPATRFRAQCKSPAPSGHADHGNRQT